MGWGAFSEPHTPVAAPVGRHLTFIHFIFVFLSCRDVCTWRNNRALTTELTLFLRTWCPLNDLIKSYCTYVQFETFRRVSWTWEFELIQWRIYKIVVVELNFRLRF